LEKTQKKDSVLWTLFIIFLKISPVTFGGGFAMIPQLEQELVDRKKWMKKEEISDVFAVVQSFPGSVAVNSAIFTGYHIAGGVGAVTAMIGILLPSFFIILSLAILFLGIQDAAIVQAAFHGIRPAIVALILFAAYKIGKTAIKDITTLFFLIVTLYFLLFTSVHPAFVILVGGISGVLFCLFKEGKE
jgi:chromate transporter